MPLFGERQGPLIQPAADTLAPMRRGHGETHLDAPGSPTRCGAAVHHLQVSDHWIASHQVQSGMLVPVVDNLHAYRLHGQAIFLGKGSDVVHVSYLFGWVYSFAQMGVRFG